MITSLSEPLPRVSGSLADVEPVKLEPVIDQGKRKLLNWVMIPLLNRGIKSIKVAEEDLVLIQFIFMQGIFLQLIFPQLIFIQIIFHAPKTPPPEKLPPDSRLLRESHFTLNLLKHKQDKNYTGHAIK